MIGRPSEHGVNLRDTTLKPNTLYRFRVLARSSSQEAPLSAPLTVMTPPLGLRGDVAVVRILPTSVRVKWHAHLSAADISVKWVVQVKQSYLEPGSNTKTLRLDNKLDSPRGSSAQNFRVSPLRTRGSRGHSSGVQKKFDRTLGRSQTPRRFRPTTTPRRNRSRQREPGSTPWGYAGTPTKGSRTPRRGGGGVLKAGAADEDEWLDAVQERVISLRCLLLHPPVLH